MNYQDSRRRDLVSVFSIIILLVTGTALALPSVKARPEQPASDRLVLVDSDGDGIPDWLDACPSVPNLGPIDLDGDELTDRCDLDSDGDGVLNLADRCPLVAGDHVTGCPVGG